MSRIDKLVAGVTIGALAVGASVALHATGPTSTTTTTKVPPSHTSTTADDAKVQHATKAVYASAQRLTEEIRHARTETTTVLAKSFASLASQQAAMAAERSQLAGEQAQINAEVVAINARAAALSQEGAQLQREAAALSRAHRGGTTTPPNPGGNGYDN